MNIYIHKESLLISCLILLLHIHGSIVKNRIRYIHTTIAQYIRNSRHSTSSFGRYVYYPNNMETKIMKFHTLYPCQMFNQCTNSHQMPIKAINV